jgi:hypothetical protein
VRPYRLRAIGQMRQDEHQQVQDEEMAAQRQEHALPRQRRGAVKIGEQRSAGCARRRQAVRGGASALSPEFEYETNHHPLGRERITPRSRLTAAAAFE